MNFLPQEPSNHGKSPSTPSSRKVASHQKHTASTSGPTRVLSSLDPSFRSSPTSCQFPKDGSRFTGSQSSSASDPSFSALKTSHRSGFGVGKLASVLSRSSKSNSVSVSSQPTQIPIARSRSIAETDYEPPVLPIPHHPPLASSLRRPRTAPHSPSQLSEIHTRADHGLSKNITVNKPSLHSSSGFSQYSSPSDTDASSRSRGTRQSLPPRRPCVPAIDVAASPISPNSHTYSTPDSQHSFSPNIHSARTSASQLASEESLSQSPHQPSPTSRGREHRQRNVLRRKPSGSLKAVSASKEKEESRPPHGLTIPSSLIPGKRSTLPASPTFSAFTSSNARTNSRDSRGEPLASSLTPARAVVHAYKQQEMQRENLNPISSKPEEYMVELLGSSQEGSDAAAKSPTPYYTVFGHTSDRVVPAGGPGDRWHGYESHVIAEHRARSEHPDHGGRSLTRKVSARFKKATGGILQSEESPSGKPTSSHRGRPSLQNVPLSLSTERHRPGGHSMDYVEFHSPENTWSDSAHGGPFETDAMRCGNAKHGKDNAGEGGKIWKLVKRISTGGLRERFQAEKAPPPVPAIPKELLANVHHPPNDDSGLERIMSSPFNGHQPKQRQPSTPRPATAPRNIPPPRPSMATTSSSPNSSEVASTRFFNRTHSAKSSISSYGEEVRPPPMPDLMLDRHIIPRQELLRLAHEDENSQESSRSRSPHRPASASVDNGTLASPQESFTTPRKVGAPIGSEGIKRISSTPTQSPLGPSFSTTDPINTFTPPKKSRSDGSHSIPVELASQIIAGASLTPPPPRPTRSLLRALGASPKSEIVASETLSNLNVNEASPNRSSYRVSSGAHSNASTAKGRPRSNSFNSATPTNSDDSQLRSALTFRELDAPRRPPLSEQEKAEIWDSLLERSAQAGGTLHLSGGGGGLMSDHMRFSNYSELL